MREDTGQEPQNDLSPIRCPCGGQTQETCQTRAAGKLWHLLKCTRCHRVLLHPRPAGRALQRHYAADYYGTGEQKFLSAVESVVSFFRAKRARQARRLLTRMQETRRHDPRVLDIGCGNGGFLAALQRMGCKCHGTELNERTARRARGIPGLTVHTGDLPADAYPPDFFGLICIWHVLEHLEDPDRCLDNCRHWLCDGGILLLAVPNIESWQARLFRGAWFHLDPPRHLFHFGPHSLRHLLATHGFTILEVRHLSLEQNVYGILQSVLNTLGFPRDDFFEALKGNRPFRPFSRDTIQALILGLTILPAVVFTLLEAAAGRGGTVSVIARRSP